MGTSFRELGEYAVWHTNLGKQDLHNELEKIEYLLCSYGSFGDGWFWYKINIQLLGKVIEGWAMVW